MRFVRVVLALVFGLAMAGPETHACPVHNAAPPGQHQHDDNHQEDSEQAHCTCPQTCGPAAVNALLPNPPAPWTAAALVIKGDRESIAETLLPSRTHVLPFAQAPPLRA